MLLKKFSIINSNFLFTQLFSNNETNLNMPQVKFNFKKIAI